MTFYEAVISMKDGYVVLEFGGIGVPTSLGAFVREVESHEQRNSPDWSFVDYEDTQVSGAALALAISSTRPIISLGAGNVVLESADPVEFANSLDDEDLYTVRWGDY